MKGPSRSARTALVALCCALFVAGSAGATPIKRSTGTLPSSSTAIQFGAYPRPKTNKVTKKQAVLDLESKMGKTLAVVRVFDSWNTPFPDSFTKWLGSTGREISLSVKCKLSNGTAVGWANIASSIAKADPNDPVYKQALAWANEVKSYVTTYSVPMYFIFNHEPEAKASSACGTAPDFIKAWRAMYGLFQDHGVTNVQWVWTMTDFSFLVPPSDSRYAQNWYPGDAYVDDIAADVYNWFDCRYQTGGPKNAWKSLETLTYSPGTNLGGVTVYTDALNETLIANGQQPKGEILMEFASVEDTTTPDPTRKAQWISDAETALKGSEWSYLKAALWFNTVDGTYPACAWWVDTSNVSLTAIQNMAADPYFNG